MGNHGSKQLRGQIGVLFSKFASYIAVRNPLRYTGSFDLSDPLSLITRAELDIATGGGFKVLAPWAAGVPTGKDEYRTRIIGGIEYLFRSEIPNNLVEPTLDATGLMAWHTTGIDGAPPEYNNITPYDLDVYVYRNLGGSGYHAYRSKVAGNTGNIPEASPDEWEHIGPYKFPYDSGETYDANDFVFDPGTNTCYISQIEDNTFPFDYVIPGTKAWNIIGAIGSGSAGTPTTGTIEAASVPLVITWDTDLVPDDEDGRTYLEKHGPLEKVTIQVTMPDPTAPDPEEDPLMTVFPNWRFDENTKNILTIDNQGQKLYYVIGFGADGSSGSGGTTINFVDEEVPTGAINGVNVTYTLAFVPAAGSLKLYLNGLRQKRGAGNDYTLAGNTITMADPLETDDVLIADYRK